MPARRLLAAFALLPLLAAPLLTAPPAGAAPAAPTPHAERSAVSVSVSDSLVEGDRFDVSVRISRTHGARRILLQRWTADYAGSRHWETVHTAKVRGHTRTFSAIAGTDDVERYRARVEYAQGRPAHSKPAAAQVWHWTALSRFADYYHTPGVFAVASGGIAGVRYNGVFTYGSYGSWEIRYTLGRHCRSVRGLAGLDDDSADGTSAVISLVADETTPVLTSGELVPGTAQPFQVDLALPYRLSLQMRRTSPAGAQVHPAIGDPELLCTGLGA